MKIAKAASYYDAHFKNDVTTHGHYKNSFYFVHWTQVIVLLRKISSPEILEIGCGTGQLAEYLRDEGYTKYFGFDFSSEAIALANERSGIKFMQGDALDSSLYKKLHFNTVICLEVLEHIKQDIKIIKNLSRGTRIIFSVPNFDAPSHVRWFNSEREIKKRYFQDISFEEIIRVGNLFICKGVDFVTRFCRKNPF
jgi:2-polyprenyl-3-methyl-5-hydroxy-6-metoxy-1,4-benzoquinol methylase